MHEVAPSAETAAKQGISPAGRPWRWFALAIACLYAAVAVAVHHAGPFYVFDMYAFPARDSTSRLSLIDADGALLDVRRVAALRCDGDARAALSVSDERCAGVFTVDARDDEVWDILQRRRPAAGASLESMRLVRRVFDWREGRVRGFDCAAVPCDVLR